MSEAPFPFPAPFLARLQASREVLATPVSEAPPQAAVAQSEAPQTPFSVEQVGADIMVTVHKPRMTLREAQDLTARLLVVQTPMWKATMPKGRL